MALKKPLVLGTNGLPQNLQPGDSLDAPISEAQIYELINGEAAPIVIGAPVYLSAAGTVKLGKADAAATAAIQGIVGQAAIANGVAGDIVLDGPMTATAAQWGAVIEGGGVLTPNAPYFLSPTTAGKITATPPTAAGQLNMYIGRAFDTLTLNVKIGVPILL